MDNTQSITDPKLKIDVLNKQCASKYTVPCPNDNPPKLNKFNVLSDLSQINTSPIELSKVIRSMKKSNHSHCGITGKFLSLKETRI